ncbi:MAG: thioredoxin [Proteobacteria bacterium]|nr:thioredoxin [Pseudomonadota bacterium]
MSTVNETLTLRVTENTFEQDVIYNSNPVLVDFWADWCAPCHMIAPVLEEISDEYHDRLRVAKLNVDENPAIQERFGIRSIPTLMLFKDGELKEKVVGVQSKSQLNSLINRHM